MYQSFGKWGGVRAGAVPEVSRFGQRVLLVQMAVAEVMGVRLTDMCAGGRGNAKAAFARQLAMYLCHLVYAMRPTHIAIGFGRDRSTASYALRRIEEAREQPDVDRWITWLECTLRRAGGAS